MGSLQESFLAFRDREPTSVVTYLKLLKRVPVNTISHFGAVEIRLISVSVCCVFVVFFCLIISSI